MSAGEEWRSLLIGGGWTRLSSACSSQGCGGGSPPVLEQKRPRALWRTLSLGVLTMPQGDGEEADGCRVRSPHLGQYREGMCRQLVQVLTHKERTVLGNLQAKGAEKALRNPKPCLLLGQGQVWTSCLSGLYLACALETGSYHEPWQKSPGSSVPGL